MSDDYYAILELQRTASEAEIKKAYRRMALRWHPDKNQDKKEEADHKFKEISEAYEVLSDPSKRQIYDVYGKAGLENGGGSSGAAGASAGRFGYGGGGFHAGFHGGFHSFVFRDPQEVFREFFGGRDPFADFLFADPFESLRQQQQHHQQQHQQLFQSSFVGFPTFQLHDPFFSFGHFGGAGAFPAAGGAQFLSYSSSGFGPNTQFRSSSTSTRVVNGRQIVTKKVMENGVETVTVTENGVVIQQTVNGRPQPIDAAPAPAAVVHGSGGGRSSAGASHSARSSHGASGGGVGGRPGSGTGSSAKRFGNQVAEHLKKQRRGDPK